MAAFIGNIVLFCAIGPVRGWALSQLWLWFVVPTFHVPALSIPAAMGVMYFVGLLTVPSLNKDKHDEYSFGERVGIGIAISLMAVGMGWIVRLFL